MSFSTHNQFQLGLPNKQPSFLTVSRVNALTNTSDPGANRTLDDRVTDTGSAQPPTFTADMLRGFTKNTLPATNLATIGGVGVSRNPTVQNAALSRRTFGVFDLFNRTNVVPTGNTDINDSIQFSGGGVSGGSSVLNPVLSQPGVGSDEGSGLAVVNVDPVTGLATGYSFTGTQDSTLPNNGTYAYITPCLASVGQPLPSQVTVGQVPPDSQCNDGNGLPESIADNSLVSPVQNEIFYNPEATGLVKGGSALESFSNFGLNQGKVLKGGNAVAAAALAGPTPTPASFEGVSLDNTSTITFNDADKPVYLTVQDMLGAGNKAAASFDDGDGKQIFTTTLPPLNPNTLAIALEYRLLGLPAGAINPGDSVAVQWKVTFNVSGQNTGTRFGVGTQIMIPVAGFGATGNGNPILNLFGGPVATATKFENAFAPGASPAVTTSNKVRITENLIITLTEKDLIGGTPYTDLDPKTLKTKNQSVLQPRVINAAGTRVFTQIMSTSANAAFDLPGGIEPQLVLPGPGGFIVN